MPHPLLSSLNIPRIKAPTKLEIRNVLILACQRTSDYYTLELSTLHNELIPQNTLLM